MNAHGKNHFDFFLAHAGPDETVAEELYDKLNVHARVFLDSKSLELGDDWDIRLPAAQRRSRVTVVLISTRTPRAFYQREEIAAAIAHARRNPDSHRVVPVYLSGDCSDNSPESPYGLRVKHGIRVSHGVSLQDVASRLLQLLDLPSGDSDAADQSPTRPKTLQGLPPRPELHGRDSELGFLQACLEDVLNADPNTPAQKPQLVLVAGESGVGKSALAMNAMREAHDMGFLTCSVVCEPFHEGMSFFPVREVIRQIQTEPSIIDEVSQYYGTESTQTAMARLLDRQGAEPSQRRDALIATFVNVLFARFRQNLSWEALKPLLIFLDDLDRIDTGTADALLCFLSRAREGPVVILGAYRTDLIANEDHPLSTVIRTVRRSSDRAAEIELESLDKSSLPDATRAILGASCHFPWRFYELLYQETEGNPLFLREILRSLSTSRKCILKVDGEWILDSEPNELAIPSSVEEVIRSRLDLLDKALRTDLEVASVIGRRFAFEVISKLSEASEDVLLQRVERLLAFDIINEISEEDDTFEFSHGKIRDVLYQSMPRIRRRRIHAQVAEVLRSVRHTTSEDWDALLGEHLYIASKYSEAVSHLITAARNAMALHAGLEAAGLYGKAIESGAKAGYPKDIDPDQLKIEQVEAYKLVGDYPRARTACRKIIDSTDQGVVKGWALNHLGDIFWTTGHYEQSVECYLSSEQIARQSQATALLVETVADLQELYDREAERLSGIDDGRVQEYRANSEQYLRELMELAETVDDPAVKARAWRNRAKSERSAGRLDSAIASYERAVGIRDSNVPTHSILISYAKTLRYVGRLEEARQIVNRVLDWSLQAGARRSIAIAYQYRGLLRMEARGGDSGREALSDLQRAQEFHEELGYARGLREIYTLLGEWYLNCGGDKETAVGMFRKAIDADVENTNKLIRLVATQLRARDEVERASALENQWRVLNQ